MWPDKRLLDPPPTPNIRRFFSSRTDTLADALGAAVPRPVDRPLARFSIARPSGHHDQTSIFTHGILSSVTLAVLSRLTPHETLREHNETQSSGGRHTGTRPIGTVTSGFRR